MARKITKIGYTQLRQVFVVSYFPLYAEKAQEFVRMDRASAEKTANQLRADFARYPHHNPIIDIERTERMFTHLGDDLWSLDARGAA